MPHGLERRAHAVRAGGWITSGTRRPWAPRTTAMSIPLKPGCRRPRDGPDRTLEFSVSLQGLL
jgi:hypothetical protein